ncbi:ArnT family glycosyltransferase [Marinicrinis sediminis]|uniref:ArnT family glycosyltransferase n=1 Tax=Marinicrinis sediminis TaxID=1652465 RepID=A0ABW5R812_9BACL
MVSGLRNQVRPAIGKLILIFLIVFVIRAVFAVSRVASWDEADFALGLVTYDIFHMQPHFPGYPVLIALGRMLNVLVDHEVYALSLVSALAGGVTTAAAYAWMTRFLSGMNLTARMKRWGPWLLVLLLTVHPVFALSQIQPMSDALGLCFVVLLFGCTWRSLESGRTQRERWGLYVLACVLAGLLVGVRISYFPVGFLLLMPWWMSFARQRTWWKGICAAGIGLLTLIASIALWLLPTAQTEGGLQPYLALGASFTEGHFQEWGGTAATSGSLAERALHWLIEQGWWAGGFGTYPDAFASYGLHGWSVAAVGIWTALLIGFVIFAVVWKGHNRHAHSSARHATTAQDAGLADLNETNRMMPFSPSVDGESDVMAGGAHGNETHAGSDAVPFWLRASYVALAVVPYGLWSFFGQNAAKWRHNLPLYVWLMVGVIVIGFTVYRRWVRSPADRGRGGMLKGLFAAYVIVLLMHTAVHYVDISNDQPVHRLVEQVQQLEATEGPLVLYTWEEKRVFDVYAPEITVVRLLQFERWTQSAAAYRPAVKQMLLTNKVLEGFNRQQVPSLQPYVTRIASWRGNAFLDPVYHDIELYALDIERYWRDQNWN